MSTGPWNAAAAVVVLVMGVLAAVRIALTGSALPATAGEAGLLGAGSARVDEIVAHAQVSAYSLLTGAAGRHPEGLGVLREAALVSGVVLLVALVVAAWRLRIRAIAVTVVLALFVVGEPAVTTLATFGPAQLGVTWLAVGGVLLTWGARTPRAVGVLAVLVGLVTAPLLAVPVAVLVVAATARRWAPTAEVAAALGSGLLVLVVLTPAPVFTAVTGPGRLGLLAVAVVVVIAALVLRRRDLRVPAVGAVSAVLLAAPSWAGADAAVPLLVVAVLVLGAGAVDGLAARLEQRPRGARIGVLGAATAGWVALAVVLVILPGVRTAGDAQATRSLAAWITTSTDPSTTVTAPSDVATALISNGVPAGRLTATGTVQVTVGEPAAGNRLARFGSGAGALNVAPAPGGAPDDRAARISAGTQLAANPDLIAPPDVRAAMAAGDVDPRALVLLAGLSALGPVQVAALPAVSGEDIAVPRHQVALPALDPQALAWVRAQQPPFAPTVSDTAGGTTLTWPIPAPSTVLGP